MEKFKCVDGELVPYDENDWAMYEKDVAERSKNLAVFVRANRNERPFACDWTQMPDYNGADKAVWAAYRQALRDIPQQPGFPENVTWPVPPT